ncbi:MAG: Nramp family divalent metal transporter, partial [Planctomycetales bacterium]|nr:Nramp family divalent metal transporter [Planctomycetales bacterium]
AWAFLWRGTYADLEKLIGILVATFSLSVIVGLFLLQGTENAITWQQIRSGMTFSLGDGDRRAAAIAVVSLMGALGATANELFMYPYWLLEKGYARQVGSPDDEGWVERARGWIRIMQLDVTACTLLATLATVGYFLLGAAVFHGRGSGAPTGDHIVEQLSAMYTESYGDWSKWVFQLGALGTLFSTLIVATAAFGRMWSDMLISLGLVGDSPSTQLKTQRTVVSIYLLLSLLIAILAGQPPEAPVIFGQFVAGMFCTPLMAIAICAMAFRTDRRLRMSGATAFFLVTTSLIFVGCVAANMIIPFLGKN